jgi:hypothetical protein
LIKVEKTRDPHRSRQKWILPLKVTLRGKKGLKVEAGEEVQFEITSAGYRDTPIDFSDAKGICEKSLMLPAPGVYEIKVTCNKYGEDSLAVTIKDDRDRIDFRKQGTRGSCICTVAVLATDDTPILNQLVTVVDRETSQPITVKDDANNAVVLRNQTTGPNGVFSFTGEIPKGVRFRHLIAFSEEAALPFKTVTLINTPQDARAVRSKR